jgi:hypothetical protein
MEMTSGTLETDFQKVLKCEKIDEFVFLVQLTNSRFYFRMTHKNTLFLIYFIIIEDLFEKQS